MTPEDSKRLDEMNEKLDRLLAILEGPDMKKEHMDFCMREAFRGNWEPLFGDAAGKSRRTQQDKAGPEPPRIRPGIQRAENRPSVDGENSMMD